MSNSLSHQHTARSVKILIAGGFGAGKTTMVGRLSEIPPLSTEEMLTAASVGTDSLAGVEGKTTTTVALDFGRITFPEPRLIIYLFGTPGQERFWFMWNDLCVGALGAVVLVDTRRLEDSFSAIDFFEDRGIPYVVAVNLFDRAPHYPLERVRAALNVGRDVTVVECDARTPASARDVLIALVEQLIVRGEDTPLPHRATIRTTV
jgi:uncharacterized protein